MRLGYISLSGVRIRNQELMDLGLSLPGFMERAKTISSLPNLGLLTLAALTPADITVSYLSLDSFNKENELPGNFDVVAISSVTAKIKDAYSLADKFRSKGTKVILGGIHVTLLPGEAAEHADTIVLGEGEIYWEKLIEDLKSDNLQKVYDARGRSFDLSKSPIPRYDLLDIEQYNRITVQTQRGCPWSCEFCASSIRISPKFKTKPINRVEQEIKYIKSLWNKPFIELADDNTFVDKRYGKELAKIFIGKNIKWFTETDVSLAEDEELLGLLRDSGCVQVLVGFENSKFSGLDRIELNNNWKAKQLDKYYKAIQKIQSYGISVNGCFILGLDGTDSSNFQDVLNFVKESELSDVQITVQTPFPGTPLYERLKKENRLIDCAAWEKCTLFDVNFVPEKMTVKELEDNFRLLMKELYNEDLVKKRRKLFQTRFKESRKNEKFE